MSFNPHSDPVARQLHDATAELRGIRDQLREQSEPPDARAARRAERDAQTRATAWGVRVALGLAAAWLVLSLVFGRAGQRLFGGLLGLVWDVLEVLVVLGGALWVGGAVFRAGRTLFGVGRSGRVDGAP